MLLNLPDNLSEQQKKRFEQLWLNIIMLVVNAIKFFVLLAFTLILFSFFGDYIINALQRATQRPEVVDPNRPVATRSANETDEFDRIENGIHVMSGLKVAEGWEVVRGVCTACHSAKMITQTKATRDGWLQMIRWMQKNQGLWDLGEQEKIILDYLAAHYAPDEGGRRPNLDLESIEWYVLEEGR